MRVNKTKLSETSTGGENNCQGGVKKVNCVKTVVVVVLVM
jgi:hypothetical protein